MAALVTVLALVPAARERAFAEDSAQPAQQSGVAWLDRVVHVVTASAVAPTPLATARAAIPAPRIDGAFLARGAVHAADVSSRAIPSAAAPILEYRVVSGDTLVTIAERFGVSPMTIWWANRLTDKDTLKVGQLVRVLPTSGIEHVVRDGDTLDSIARAFRADAAQIAAYNGLQGGVVVLGQRLILPDGNGSGYDPIPGVDRQTPLPRLRPGQADRAVVDQPAVAAPLIQPIVPDSQSGGVKRSGGVGWPVSPNWTAGGSWLVRPDDREPVDRNGPGRGPARPVPRPAPPAIVIPADAPVVHGDGPIQTDWPPGGPPAGPPQGTVLQIEDARLKLTPERALLRQLLLWPVHGGGKVSQYFGGDHYGLDIAAARGTPVLATFSGRVIYRGWRDERGANSVWIRHGPKLYSSYAHLWRFAVARGQWVKRGEVIGYVGSTGYSTGPHVHFAITVGDQPNAFTEAVDPLPFVAGR